MRHAFVLAVGLLAITRPATAQQVPIGFVYEQVVGGPFIGEPGAFAFLPDRRPVILERETGNVRIAAVGATSSVLIHTIPNIMTGAERGLLGVVADGDWPTRPYLYFYYTRTDATSRLIMLTASGALTDSLSTSITLANPYDLLIIPDTSVNHNGGGLAFGPDGMLYLTLGEDGLRCFAQDKTSLLGKLVRLDMSLMPGGGSGPPPKADLVPVDNPFADAVNENERLLWAWGLRNPFGFSIDPVTGDTFIGDVGSTVSEEIDLLPFASGGGLNFGWPIREGFTVPTFGDTCGQSNDFTEPIFAYLHDEILPSAVIAGPLYRFVPNESRSFPVSYEGSYFFADWARGWIRRIVPGKSAEWELAPPVNGQPTAENWAQIPDVVQVEEGSDGALYLVRRAGVRGLYRIRYSPPTTVELASAGSASLSIRAEPNPSGAEGTTVTWFLPRAGAVTVRIVDVSGRTIRDLVTGNVRAGVGAARWDGMDTSGAAVAAGTYFCRIVAADGETASSKVARVR